MSSIQPPTIRPSRAPRNRNRLIGQKRPLLPRHVWAIRARLELANRPRDLALFNLAIDSKLRGCDLVRLKVADLVVGGLVRDRVSVTQRKTRRPVQFEVAENSRTSVLDWVTTPAMRGRAYLFPSRVHSSPHLSTRQYARLVRDWVSTIGLEPSGYGTHSLRRTKAALIYRKTGNLRAVQLLLGHSKVDSTVRYLGVELDDALSIAEKVEI
ncbi:MAG: tyrosine-type recombinase/integrase [Rhodobacteraceae bacterium]|nr:tyrosine-type recombinase/integrase [Paracoccaceae bacterium]